MVFKGYNQSQKIGDSRMNRRFVNFGVPSLKIFELSCGRRGDSNAAQNPGPHLPRTKSVGRVQIGGGRSHQSADADCQDLPRTWKTGQMWTSAAHGKKIRIFNRILGLRPRTRGFQPAGTDGNTETACVLAI